MTRELVLRTALGKSPLARALKEGAVASDRVGFDFVEVDPVTRAFRRMTRAMEFDLCEIALTTHAQARAYGKPITALPVVLLRGLHHGALTCRHDSSAARAGRSGGQTYRRARLVADHRCLGTRHSARRVRHRA